MFGERGEQVAMATMSRMVMALLRIMMYSKGRKKSFWNEKLSNSPA